MLGLRHIHRRKTHHKGLSNHKDHTPLDYLVYFCAIAGPVMTIPQIYLIWVNKNASGVSITSWLAYTLLTFVWIYYGIVHKDKPILITNILWLIVNGLVTLGAIIY